MDYSLELDRVVKTIQDSQAKTVCIQLPDGLKPEAGRIADELSSKTSARIFIWLGSCYGACDIPPVERMGVDLLVQWGHSEFR